MPSYFSKMIKLIEMKLQQYISDSFSPFQFGFRLGSSTDLTIHCCRKYEISNYCPV